MLKNKWENSQHFHNCFVSKVKVTISMMADGDRADLAQRWPNGGVLSGRIRAGLYKLVREAGEGGGGIVLLSTYKYFSSVFHRE